MLDDDPVLKWTFVTLLVLLVLPLIAMVVMMAMGAASGAGMMSQMTGMMGGSGGTMMGGGMMALSALWTVVVAVALVCIYRVAGPWRGPRLILSGPQQAASVRSVIKARCSERSCGL